MSEWRFANKDNAAVQKLLAKNIENIDGAACESQLLILAETMFNDIFTSSNIIGYFQHSCLNYYTENFAITNQNIGVRGIQVSNLIINVPRDSISVGFFNAFSNKIIFNRLEIAKIGTSNSNMPVLQEQILYTSCRIEQYKNVGQSVEMSVRYATREDLYIQYQDGIKNGIVVSEFVV
jgi:hypothetical protein